MIEDMDLAIRCRDLRKTYEGKVEAVRGLDLEIQAGECFGLLGPNGAGKTTTIEILEGLLPPTSGEVEILGRTWSVHTQELREMGIECAGRIAAVGEGVTGFAIGASVMAIALDSLASHVIADARLVRIRPQGLTAVEACALPIVFATAHHARG